jgi:DNA mismatch endonuclease, patch repair protein
MSSSRTEKVTAKAKAVYLTSTVDSRRRANMQAVRGKDTKPELVVREVAHRIGLRYRLHSRDLPGRPDLVFPKWKTVLFVNGCFWHQHPGCKKATIPKSNRPFWDLKLRRNVERDREVREKLSVLGWSSVTIWECEAKDLIALETTLTRFFANNPKKESNVF